MARRPKPTTAPPPRSGTDHQPISHVEWVPRDALRANDYNPNAMAPPERALLRTSILEDGWTQPIVARSDGEIVDGYHRWLTASDKDVAAMTGGLVPVVRLDTDPATQRMATIRHNRARGAHGVLRMADIATQLSDELGVPVEEIGARLSMEDEEVRRLLMSGGATQWGGVSFNRAWVPGGDDWATDTTTPDED